LCITLLVAACSASTTQQASTTGAAPATSLAAFPVDVATAVGTVIVPTRPERIAALSATHVEMLYAIGAADQLVAGDLFSNYPPEAGELAQLDSFNLSVEAIIALEPDLVVLSFDPVNAMPALDAVGIPTLLLGTASDLDEVYAQITALGAATGHASEAAAVVDDMAQQTDAIVAEVGGRAAGLTYYHETDPFSFYTPNSQSFIGQLYGLLGMENIADAAPDDLSSGFPQLSPEFILTADPDVVFLATDGETPETMAARDGWDTLSAVATGNVFVLDPDVASRWGPRVVELMAAIRTAVEAAAP
jgi:iron complex transport system substrate-binding protein